MLIFKLKYIKSSNKFNKALHKTQQKEFFLKYFSGGKEDKTEVSSDSFDFNELLKDKNIKLNITDVYRDYKHFRHEYYYFSPYIHEKTADQIDDKKLLPFSSKTMSVKNVLKYIVQPVSKLINFNL